MEKSESSIINTEVMGDMIDARLPHLLKFTPFARVDTALVGVPGDTKTVPSWNFVGAAEDVGEGEEIAVKKLTASSTSFTVKKAMQSVSITQECINSGLGDSVGQAEAQLTRAIALKVEADVLAAALTAEQSYNGRASEIAYSAIVDALDVLDEEEITEKVMFVSPAQLTALRKDEAFLSADKYQSGVAVTGEIGMIAGVRIIPTRQIKTIKYEKSESGTLTVAEDGTEGKDLIGISEARSHTAAAVTVGDKLTAVDAYYRCPIVKLEAEDNVNELAAITIFMKKDTTVDAEWFPKRQTHEITASKYYGVALTNASKVVVAEFKA